MWNHIWKLKDNLLFIRHGLRLLIISANPELKILVILIKYAYFVVPMFLSFYLSVKGLNFGQPLFCHLNGYQVYFLYFPEISMHILFLVEKLAGFYLNLFFF